MIKQQLKNCIKIIIPLLLIISVFSGCSFHLTSSADELISPVSPQGEDADIQHALTQFADDKISLKMPLYGGVSSAFTLYDLDRDGADEAVIYYEGAKSPGILSLAILDYLNGEWTVVCNISTKYSDVYSLAFYNLNSDKFPEIVTLWDALSDSKTHYMTVYKTSVSGSKIKLSQIGDSIEINNYICADINDDKKNELTVFTLQSRDFVSAQACVYSYYSGSAERIGFTGLDGHITGYTKIISQKADGRVCIFADAIKSSGSQMITEVLYWSKSYNTVVSAFYSYETGVTAKTNRDTIISISDVDGNGIYEIPLTYQTSKKLPVGVKVFEWNKYEKYTIKPIYYTVSVKGDSYHLLLKKDIIDSLDIKYNKKNSTLTVSHDGSAFELKVVSNFNYGDGGVYKGYKTAKKSGGNIYLVKILSGSEFTFDSIKSSLKSY